MKPFIKWAGGKRWLVENGRFQFPRFSGRYIEPFLGGGAIFFHLLPEQAVLGDTNRRLVETYKAIARDPEGVRSILRGHQAMHNRDHYYAEREAEYENDIRSAAQFLYLNRTCWNGLYRENLKGKFNVPIGTKSSIFDEREDFVSIAAALSRADIECRDFEETLDLADEGDLVFIDPPYTTAHNFNGFVKYNQKIFSWTDQERLQRAAVSAKARGARVLITNAQHSSIHELYQSAEKIEVFDRASVISGLSTGRRATAELLIWL